MLDWLIDACTIQLLTHRFRDLVFDLKCNEMCHHFQAHKKEHTHFTNMLNAVNAIRSPSAYKNWNTDIGIGIHRIKRKNTQTVRLRKRACSYSYASQIVSIRYRHEIVIQSSTSLASPLNARKAFAQTRSFHHTTRLTLARTHRIVHGCETNDKQDGPLCGRFVGGTLRDCNTRTRTGTREWERDIERMSEWCWSNVSDFVRDASVVVLYGRRRHRIRWFIYEPPRGQVLMGECNATQRKQHKHIVHRRRTQINAQLTRTPRKTGWLIYVEATEHAPTKTTNFCVRVCVCAHVNAESMCLRVCAWHDAGDFWWCLIVVFRRWSMNERFIVLCYACHTFGFLYELHAAIKC